MTQKKLEKALEAFLDSEELAETVVASTLAGFSGSYYAVEVFEDGTYRTLWSSQIGNRYETPGMIMKVPGLTDENYQAYCEMAGSDDKEALARELTATDTLAEIAGEMREGFKESFYV